MLDIHRDNFATMDKLNYNRSKLMVLTLFLMGLVVIFSYGVDNVAAATPGNTIYVNGTNGNDSNNGSSWLYAKQTISNATGTVNSNGVVYIADGNYTGFGNTGITINKNMTIQGQSETGTIINGTGSGRIFTIINGVNVNIINMTLTNGLSDYGGAIHNDGIFTLNNCTLAQNSATDYGGAIFNEADGNYTINNCMFTQNTAVGGGAIDNYNGDDIFTITNSIFTQNTASHGGAICNFAQLTINNSLFTNNTQGFEGGAIYNSGYLTVTGSIFTNNTAIEGGAIYNDGTANVNFNYIFGNTASEGNQIYNCFIGNVNATDNWWGTNTPNISGNDIVSQGVNCDYNPWIVFSLNASSPVNSGNPPIITADLTHDSNGNDTSGQGTIPDGVLIQFYDAQGTLIGTGTTSNGKASINYTPNIYSGITTVNATANNTNLSANILVLNPNIYVSTTGNDITGDGSQDNPYQSISQGILMLSPGGTLHIADGIYTENNVQINTNMTIIGENQQNTIINGNNSGSIFITGSDINVTIINLTLTNANNSYGAINNEGNLTVDNSTFVNNTATDYGGAIYNDEYGTLAVDNSTFNGNNATDDEGGAIYT